jgi:hypothetical protein
MRPAYVRPRGSTAATDSADSSTSITEPRLEPNPNFETLQGVKIIFNYSEALLDVPPDVQLHTSKPAVELLTALYFHLM